MVDGMTSSKSVVIFLYTLLFRFNIVIVFDKHREKYAKPDFVKFISLEIYYFMGTGCFVFKNCRNASLSGN